MASAAHWRAHRRTKPVHGASPQKSRQWVSFSSDAQAPLAHLVEQVLQAIAGGHVAPDMGKQIIESISALAGVRQIDELEQRLQALEGKQ
ncbi:hypothetical protein [Cupriavidus sp. BIS7]|uniref:hypothetical protein n=1 Tax=Cupriavidus sp. BIS7 TaxID=1217718 RepID=UPI0012F6A207|nr:hypothetical protein [Cupriavidus sp. BIS7]